MKWGGSVPKFWSVDFDREIHAKTFEKFLRSNDDESPVDFTYFPPTGVLVYCDGIPVCCGFMAKTDAGFVLNTNIIGDRDFDRDLRNEGVIFLREALAEKAKEAGYRFVLAETDQPKLVHRLEQQGYKILKQNMTYLGRVLWP